MIYDEQLMDKLALPFPVEYGTNSPNPKIMEGGPDRLVWVGPKL